MNTSVHTPNKSISLNKSELLVRPVDIDEQIKRLNRLIDEAVSNANDRINKEVEKLEEKNRQLEEYIQSILNKGFIKGFGSHLKNDVYKFLDDYRKKGYYVIPYTGWAVIYITAGQPHMWNESIMYLNPNWVDTKKSRDEIYAAFDKTRTDERAFYMIAGAKNSGHGRSNGFTCFPTRAGDILFFSAGSGDIATPEKLAINLYYDL